MRRRLFLASTGAVLLNLGLGGCDRPSGSGLRVRLLKGSVPPQLLGQFQRRQSPKPRLSFKPVEQLPALYTQLSTWKHQTQQDQSLDLPGFTLNLPAIQTEPPQPDDLVMVGDSWLTRAIQEQLIRPLNELADLPQWSQVPRQWRRLVQRDRQGQVVADGGEIWAAPYRWGSTVLVFDPGRLARLGLTVSDWDILWQPELQGRISLPDQPREVIGLTLKRLGYSYNTPDPKAVPDLVSQLQDLNRQVRFYSSDTYLQPLVLKDTWLAVGWSADVLTLLRRYPHFQAVVPRSGTALWLDLWVAPVDSQPQPLSTQWINFCWDPAVARKISQLSRAASSLLTPGQDVPDLPEALRKHPFLWPEKSVFQKSEVLASLPSSAQKAYQALWEDIRRGG